MTNYLVLAISLGLVLILILVRVRASLPNTKVLFIIGCVLLLAMLIFDTYLTKLPIVMYNNSSILGIRIGTIPIEDFSYLIAAVLLVPALFEYFRISK